MENLTTLLIGFSIFYALILLLTHFKSKYYSNRVIAKITATVLLINLIGLQVIHYLYIHKNFDITVSIYYFFALSTIAPTFYIFSQSFLQKNHLTSNFLVINLILLVLSFYITYHIMVLVFAIGIMYLLLLIKDIYQLKDNRQYFYFEISVLIVIFAIAILILILGLNISQINKHLFISLYASGIGFIFISIATILSYKPNVISKVLAVTKEKYKVSTLQNIDCGKLIAELDILLINKKLYKNSLLDLKRVAKQLQISTNQLSELINIHIGKGFSRYLREIRIKAAKEMLIENKSLSVLNVSIEVGFNSQSNFYEAFNEIVGMTPAKFRQIQYIEETFDK